MVENLTFFIWWQPKVTYCLRQEILNACLKKNGTNIDIDDGEGDKDHQDESDEGEKAENKQTGVSKPKPK